MINVIRGALEKPGASAHLINYFEKREDIEGTLFFGYPVIGTVQETLHIDALLVSKQNGVIAFDISEDNFIEDRSDYQDNIYTKIQSKLLRYKTLVENRELNVNLEVLTYAPNGKQADVDDKFAFAGSNDELDTFLSKQIWSNNEIYPQLLSAIQAVTTIKAVPKRKYVKKPDSRGAKLKKLENSIANLDKYQNQAVIETAEGPQRIRGLAGSGKTIVLALKVAYLHTKHPDWLIAVTFYTRSLKNQFRDLITRFTYEHINEEPDWNKVKIIHAWGSPNSNGIYYEICRNHDIEYFDFNMAKSNAQRGAEFDFVCDKAIKEISAYQESYDAILVDEAQDFPESFLNLCYNILKKPKKLIWAYDELQSLKKISMRSPEEIFGKTKDGKSKVQLKNESNKPKEDIILNICYRNPRPILVTAHALGFGIYRQDGLVQMFDESSLWEEVGYEVEEGELRGGQKTVLSRSGKSSPDFLEQHSPKDDIIICKAFKSNEEQINWIAGQIEKNLKEDELEPRDIVVIHTDPIRTVKAVGPLKSLLFDRGINSHTVGNETSPDGFFETDSITFASIYRAKGNEAAMVYVMDSQECFSGSELIKKRNILFTAITRSKAWVRLCGYGNEMLLLKEEVKKIKQKDYKLEFKYPTKEEMNKLNIIHRDKTQGEKKEIDKRNKDLRNLIESLESGKLHKEDLSPESLLRLKVLVNAS